MVGANTQKDKLFNKYYRIFIIPLIALLYTVISYVINPFSKYWTLMAHRTVGQLLLELVFTLVMCWLITEFSLASSRWMDRWIPWEKHPLRRFIVQASYLLVAVFILLRVLEYLLVYLFGPGDYESYLDELDQWQFVFVCIFLSILISAVHTGNYFLKRWKTSMLESTELQLHAAALKEVAMQAQLQSLKLQLDPHFLFNNFSTLSALIEEDPKLALSFLENLSRVYRYMIINLNNDVVSLQQELTFIQAYIFLMKIRHGDNVNIQIELPAEILTKGIPPIILQLLIENAIKHNVASEQQPLNIHISQNEEGMITVSNNIQLIPHMLPSTKLGLDNIKKRYALLSERPVVVEQTEGWFVVKLPLFDM